MRSFTIGLTLALLSACSTSENALGAKSDIASGGSATSAGSEGGGEGNRPETGQLTAGEWRDLDNWEFWLDVTTRQDAPLEDMPAGWGFTFSQRYPVEATTPTGEPVVDAQVVLLDGQGQELWRARTDNLGRAELFNGLYGQPGSGPMRVEVDAGGLLSAADDVVPGTIPTAIEIDAASPTTGLDLMFIVDTTGSMGDELAYLKSELADVIDRVEVDAGQLDLRLGTVFYRDEGDAYVVDTQPFSTDVEAVVADLALHGSGGGGDWPEAVGPALESAVYDHQWSRTARARLAFLVLDAPPHEQDLPAVRQTVRDAAEAGIRIIPVASSGVDQETEALLRSIDIATGATYTFLTNDSGIGNEHLEPSVGQFEVEYLNDLLVRLIVEAVE